MTGADRFLKAMAGSSMQMIPERINPVYSAPVPQFQALPSSITSAKLVQPTKVEYYPKDDLPYVDLKGHTVEELAAAANVSVEVIEAAIKMRQQQMLIEKKNAFKPKMKKSSTVQTTTRLTTTPSTTTEESTEKIMTQSTTTTKPSTTSYAKKKIVKKAIKNGHKVRKLSTMISPNLHSRPYRS